MVQPISKYFDKKLFFETILFIIALELVDSVFERVQCNQRAIQLLLMPQPCITKLITHLSLGEFLNTTVLIYNIPPPVFKTDPIGIPMLRSTLVETNMPGHTNTLINLANVIVVTAWFMYFVIH